MRTTGNHALVTGCSSGIGRCIVEKLLADAWRVTGISRRTPELVDANFLHISADLSEPDDIQRSTRDAGPAHALVHAAGILRTGSLKDMSHDDGAMMWRLHVDAAARLVQAVVPGMNGSGCIVLIGSRVAQGALGKAYYAASKSALYGLARSFAVELAPRHITVNVIAPGATDTPMLRDPSRKAVPPKVPPMGCYIQPEEIGALTAFLLSDVARSITGQQIVVCGGASL